MLVCDLLCLLYCINYLFLEFKQAEKICFANEFEEKKILAATREEIRP